MPVGTGRRRDVRPPRSRALPLRPVNARVLHSNKCTNHERRVTMTLLGDHAADEALTRAGPRPRPRQIPLPGLPKL